MKRHLILVVCLTLFFASQTWAGQFGPITSRVQPGQFYLGGGYMWLSEELDAGIFNGASDYLETKQNSLYLQGGVGIAKGWEGYIRVGVADFNIGDDGAYQFLSSSESSNELRPFVAAGIGGPVYSGKTLTVGPFLQVSYYSDYEDEKRGTYSGLAGKEELNLDNALAVDLGFSFEVAMEGAVLYAGPMYSFYDSEIKSIFTADGGLGVETVPSDGSGEDLKLDTAFGGFIGINWPLTQTLQLNVEGQYRSGLGIGANLIYAF